MNYTPTQVSDVCFYSSTHTAFNVLQFWQNVQGEAVSLPSRPISSVHKIAKSQHQAEHLQYGLTTLESLRWTHHTDTQDEDMKAKQSDMK